MLYTKIHIKKHTANIFYEFLNIQFKNDDGIYKKIKVYV
ncbi:hypothetical protein M084_2945 [Bacteroides fragilis str. 3988 T1]|nr:hypothetical protein M084_2945 [Bacteroides fragilis str. 3988 T1]